MQIKDGVLSNHGAILLFLFFLELCISTPNSSSWNLSLQIDTRLRARCYRDLHYDIYDIDERCALERYGMFLKLAFLISYFLSYSVSSIMSSIPCPSSSEMCTFAENTWLSFRNFAVLKAALLCIQ